MGQTGKNSNIGCQNHDSRVKLKNMRWSFDTYVFHGYNMSVCYDMSCGN